MPLARLLLLVPRLLILLIVGSMLYAGALVLAALGERSLLDRMRPTLVRWHFLKPTTREERWNRAVSEVNQSALFLGMNRLQMAGFVIRRTFLGRKRMTQFLQDRARALTTHMPNIIGNLAAGDDLAMVIAGSALLDEYLGLIIAIRYHVAISKKNWERAFTFEGPLGSFGAKISMGIVLGLVIGDMINDLTYLKKIRNGFAHAVGRQAISDEAHARWARKLKMKMGLSDEVRARCSSDLARQYLESVAANVMYLSAVLNHAIAEKAFMLEHVAEINARAKESADRVSANGADQAKAEVVEQPNAAEPPQPGE